MYNHIKQVIVRQVIWNLVQAEYYLNITCACVKYIYYQNELKIKVLKMIEFFLMKQWLRLHWRHNSSLETRELPLPLNTFLELRDDSLMLTNVYRVVDNKSCKVTFTDSIYRVKFTELWIYGLSSYFTGNRFSVSRVNYDGYTSKN